MKMLTIDFLLTVAASLMLINEIMERRKKEKEQTATISKVMHQFDKLVYEVIRLQDEVLDLEIKCAREDDKPDQHGSADGERKDDAVD